MRIVFANFPYVSSFGEFRYSPLSIAEAKDLISEASRVESAVGHQATAEVISEVLDVDCQVNRINFEQQVGDILLVFKLNQRQPEGSILTRETLERIGYSLGKLERIS